jgi:hypothetical protein
MLVAFSSLVTLLFAVWKALLTGATVDEEMLKQGGRHGVMVEEADSIVETADTAAGTSVPWVAVVGPAIEFTMVASGSGRVSNQTRGPGGVSLGGHAIIHRFVRDGSEHGIDTGIVHLLKDTVERNTTRGVVAGCEKQA